jgi:demethylmenaquinone methyltransferase / 2-methoxy-6-polyprenyl-1,4-benzoquinol methylase
MKIDKTDPNSIHNYYSRIYRKYDLINQLFTFGKDKNWRKEAVETCLAEKPTDVLDLCCGTGELALHISKESGGSIRVTGYDFNNKMLEIADLKAKNLRLQQINFVCGNVNSMPFHDEAFDCITIGFGFRNLIFENPDAEKHLQEMKRVLKKGGKMLILESSIPGNRLIRIFFRLYLILILIPLGGFVSGDWKAYKYLAYSSSNFSFSSETMQLLENNGFILSFKKLYFFGAAVLIIFEKIKF